MMDAAWSCHMALRLVLLVWLPRITGVGLESRPDAESPALVYGGAGPALVYGDTGPALVYGDTGPALVYGDAGPALVYGGAGPALVYGDAGPALAHGGAGGPVLVGQDAVLLCAVRHQGDRQVSWVRSRDLQILAHAGAVFTGDARVTAPPPRAHADVTQHELRIARARLTDAGRYECQLNTEPKLSLKLNLTVLTVLPSSVAPPDAGEWLHVVGAREVRGVRGGRAVLACEAAGRAANALHDIRWYKDGRSVMPEESAETGVSLEWSMSLGRGVSRLSLRGLDVHHAGVYRCQCGAHADTVTLTVAPDDAQAMQRDGGAWSAAAGGGGAAAGGAGSALTVLVGTVLAASWATTVT